VLCRREGVFQGLYCKWSKDFMEAGVACGHSGTDCKGEVFKQRAFAIAHQISGQACHRSRYQFETRQGVGVKPFCQHGLVIKLDQSHEPAHEGARH